VARTIIPAAPGWRVAYAGRNRDRLTFDPIIAWVIYDPEDDHSPDTPVPLTPAGERRLRSDSDNAVVDPDGRVVQSLLSDAFPSVEVWFGKISREHSESRRAALAKAALAEGM
jgi:hypothetical protein